MIHNVFKACGASSTSLTPSELPSSESIAFLCPVWPCSINFQKKDSGKGPHRQNSFTRSLFSHLGRNPQGIFARTRMISVQGPFKFQGSHGVSVQRSFKDTKSLHKGPTRISTKELMGSQYHDRCQEMRQMSTVPQPDRSDLHKVLRQLRVQNENEHRDPKHTK